MHAGIPSVNMKFPEYIHILSEYPCGTMIEQCAKRQVVEAVREICEDQNKYDRMCQIAKDASKLFCWNEEQKELVRIYRNLLSL